MVTVAGLQAGVGLVDAASRLLTNEKIVNGIDRGIRTIGRTALAGSSLSALTSQTNIVSRVYIDDSLINEPVIPHMMKTLHEYYAAQIISALQLGQMVDGYRSIQDVMGIVQTGQNMRHRNIIGNIVQRRMGQESFLEEYHGETRGGDSLGLEASGIHGPPNPHKAWHGPPSPTKSEKLSTIVTDNKFSEAKEEQRKLNSDAIKATNEINETNDHIKSVHEHNKLNAGYSMTAVRSVKPSENRIGPMGELFEIKMVNPNYKDMAIIIPVYVQMQPSLIEAEVAPRFVDMNVPASTWQRWTMRQAGEISFWKDFVFQQDANKRRRALLKNPERAKAFNEFLGTIAKKDRYALDDATDTLNSVQSFNLANSVMILSEEAVAQAKLDSGIDLHNAADRQRYFSNTYTMILVIMDPLHQRVTMYFNGVDGDINTSYADYRPKDSHFDPKVFMEAIQGFSTNNIGRMR